VTQFPHASRFGCCCHPPAIREAMTTYTLPADPHSSCRHTTPWLPRAGTIESGTSLYPSLAQGEPMWSFARFVPASAQPGHAPPPFSQRGQNKPAMPRFCPTPTPRTLRCILPPNLNAPAFERGLPNHPDQPEPIYSPSPQQAACPGMLQCSPHLAQGGLPWEPSTFLTPRDSFPRPNPQGFFAFS